MCCTTSRKVTGSSPGELIGFSSRLNPSSCSMVSIQSLIDMSARNLPGGKTRAAYKIDLTAICEASTSHNSMVLRGLIQG
jgi:hypothetical protein